MPTVKYLKQLCRKNKASQVPELGVLREHYRYRFISLTEAAS